MIAFFCDKYWYIMDLEESLISDLVLVLGLKTKMIYVTN